MQRKRVPDHRSEVMKESLSRAPPRSPSSEHGRSGYPRLSEESENSRGFFFFFFFYQGQPEESQQG